MSVDSTLSCHIESKNDIKGSISELGGLKTDPTINCLLCSETFAKTDSTLASVWVRSEITEQLKIRFIYTTDPPHRLPLLLELNERYCGNKSFKTID